MTNRRAAAAGARLLPELLFVALILAAYADPLFLRGNFAGRDLLPYHLPMEREIHDAYGRGSLPLWTANVSGGRPLLPNPNLGALYPVRPLLSPLSFPLAARLYPALHWIGAGLGMILLLRVLGAGAAGAWLGAVTYVFSGVGVSEVFYTNIQPGMALLPWILWAAARPASSRSARVLPLALLFFLDLLAGDVFTITIAAAACVLWICLETGRGDRRREAASLVAALSLSALLAAPQIVATALWAPLTHRAVTGLSLQVAASFSLSPWRLLELVVPYPFGPTWSLDAPEIWGRGVFRNFFSTLFCGALVLLAIPVLRRARPPGARFVQALSAGAAAVCVLPWFLPASWGQWRSPIPLRYPEKFSVALVFALALGAGLSIEAFRNRAPGRRACLAVAVALAVVAVAARVLPAAVGAAAAGGVGAPASISFEAGRQISAAFAEAGLLWTATFFALDLLPRPVRAALPAGLLLLTAVPVLANRRIARSFPEEHLFAPPAFARFVARGDPAHAFRTLDASRYRPPSLLDAQTQRAEPAGNDFYRRSWFLYTPILWGRGTVFNADPDVGDLSRMESLRRLSALFPSTGGAAALFSSFSLRHAVRYRDQEPLPGFRGAGGDALQSWDENPGALPAVRVPALWREETGPVEALRALSELAPGEVVIESGRPAGGTSAGAAVETIEDRPERLRFSAVLPAPGWVFVLRGFWPYRTVLVDGRPVTPVPAQLAFSAIPLPAGRHRVDWREDFPGGSVSWLGPFLFLAAAFGLRRADRASSRRKREREAASFG